MDGKLRDLLQVTLSKTEAGALRWDAFDPESFRVRIGTGYLHLQRRTPDYSPRVIDAEIAEQMSFPKFEYAVQVSVAQGRIVTESEVVESLSDESGLVIQLFNAARKSALKSDRVIDEMLHVLRSA